MHHQGGRRTSDLRFPFFASTTRTWSLALLATCSLGLVGCDRPEVVGAGPSPKAITVATLRAGIPRSEMLVAGVVEPYRRSDVSFDVSGIVREVIDLGESAEGPQLDGAGTLLLDDAGVPVREGTILAVLDSTRFQQSVTAAELALASADRELDALRVELDSVYPARVDNARATAAAASADVVSARESVTAAEAELELALTTVERDRVLIQSGAVAQSVLDQSESSFRTATASLAQARATLTAASQSEQSAIASQAETEGSLRVRKADLESLEASRAELVNSLEQARTDLESSVLRAPFQGRVTARHVERGAYANAGTSIVELTMETAVKAVITVSAREEREITLGMQMPIYASDVGPSGSASFVGTVFEKASVADSGTRTFRIGLIVPNARVGQNATSAASFASISDLFPVVQLPGTPADHLFVNVACTFVRDGKTFVLALPEDIDRESLSSSLVVPRVIPVKLADDWQQLDRWTLRRLDANAGLQAGETLIVNPSEADREGVRVGSPQFAFRPGDIVRVGLSAGLPQSGFWVPATAIVPRSGANLLFLADEGRVTEVAVDVVESSGGYRRVSAPQLAEGVSVVVRGMQYLSDGDAVTSQLVASEGDQ